MEEKGAEVIESIKEIDSELISLWSKEDFLENEKKEELLQEINKIKDKKWDLRQEKARIIEENREIVYLNDVRAVTKAIDIFRTICSEEYDFFKPVENHLYALQREINEKLDKLKETSSVNAVKEEPVEETN